MTEEQFNEMTPEEQMLQHQRQLANAHAVEAHLKGATITNFGWVQDEGEICSKTSHGVLESVWHEGEIIHRWL